VCEKRVASISINKHIHNNTQHNQEHHTQSNTHKAILVEQRTGTEEPGFDNVRQTGGGNVTPQHLFGVVPSHAAIRRSAAHEDDLGLILFARDGHALDSAW
jgi:hypothetical protein